MTSKDEILDAMRQATADVLRTFGPLTAAQLDCRVHQEEGGWTAKEVLAHLAAGGVTYERMLQRLVDGQPIFGQVGSLHDRNHQMVAAYVEKDKDELLAAFQAGQTALAAKVQALSDDLLASVVALSPDRQMPKADLLLMIGGKHASGHAQEVEQALVAPAVP
jgi:hypothetical protein